MIYKTGEWVFSNGYKFFDLGTVTLKGDPLWGLIRFKEEFSPHGLMRNSFIKDIK